ncbi:MAG TPA: response regulator, partial [Chitinophagaceae bacterium]
NGVANPMVVLSSGDEAIVYLSGVGKYSNRDLYPLPLVLLLDMKLPGSTDGLSVLKWVRQMPGLQSLLIIVISELEDPAVIGEAYRLGANSYLMKPANGEEVRNLIRGFNRYWALEPESAPVAAI